MVWFIFAILAAFFDATYYLLIKKLVRNTGIYVLAGGIFLCASIILLLVSSVRGIPYIGPAFYFSVLATVILNIAITVLYFKALKITDLSIAAPMMSFTPIFLIITSFILLNELPNIFGMAGIFVIVIGSYILNAPRSSTKSFHHLKEIFSNRGILFMLIVAFLSAISSNFDKSVVKNSDPFFGSSIVYLLLGVSFLTISSIKSEKTMMSCRKNLHKFFFIGLVLSLIAITINIAFTTQIVPYVISLKRLSIMFSVFYGSLIFKEKNIVQRSLGTLLMLIGVILIVAF